MRVLNIIALTPEQTNNDQTKITKGVHFHSAQASLRLISRHLKIPLSIINAIYATDRLEEAKNVC
jgi:hypothetical protein